MTTQLSWAGLSQQSYSSPPPPAQVPGLIEGLCRAQQTLVSKQKYLLIIPSFFLEILLSRCFQYWGFPSLSVTSINWEPILHTLYSYWLWSMSKDLPACRKTSPSLQVIFSYLYSIAILKTRPTNFPLFPGGSWFRIHMCSPGSVISWELLANLAIRQQDIVYINVKNLFYSSFLLYF